MANAVNLQYQVRQNNEELQDFLKDLYQWEDEVKAKEKLLKNSKVSSDSSHPVRNKRSKKKPKSILKTSTVEAKSRLKRSDFQAWDKYDVNQALKEIDEQEDLETQSTSEDDSEDEDIAEHRRLQQALFEKEKGNELFKEGKYEAAINRYTIAIGLDPNNCVLPANRAMALIKVERYGAAIKDCDTALDLDNTYVKAYARRAIAKQYLQRFDEAIEDFKLLLKFQPDNKQALDGIEKIDKMLAKESKSKEERNTKTIAKKEKPMKRYEIQEIGSASSDEDTIDLKDKKRDCRTDLIQTMRNHNLSDMKTDETIPKPIKTVGENTRNSRTREDNDDTAKLTCKNNDDNRQSSSQSATSKKHIICDLSPPTSSMQFHSTWEHLKSRPEQLYEYMKIIPPERLPKVMGESIESSLLVKMFSILHEFYVRDSRLLFNELKYISQVKRFSMTLMFLSSSEKSVVKDLFCYLEKIPGDQKHFTESELQTLKRKYHL